MLAKLTSKNQLTLPKAVMADFKEAEYFDVTNEHGRIVLTPVRVNRARRRAREAGGARSFRGGRGGRGGLGSPSRMTPRWVLDTNVLLSALLFPAGRVTWLRDAWRAETVLPLASRATIAELIRVLSYAKFRLTDREREDLLGDYLPYCESVVVSDPPWYLTAGTRSTVPSLSWPWWAGPTLW